MVKLGSVRQLKLVACGRAHTLMVSENGILYSMGDNSYGQLGVSQKDL